MGRGPVDSRRSIRVRHEFRCRVAATASGSAFELNRPNEVLEFVGRYGMAQGSGGGSGSGGTKQASGPTGFRTVLQLLPADYRITLLFLGDKRISQGAGYRCRFGLRRGADPVGGNPNANALPPLTEIPHNAILPASPTG